MYHLPKRSSIFLKQEVKNKEMDTFKEPDPFPLKNIKSTISAVHYGISMEIQLP